MVVSIFLIGQMQWMSLQGIVLRIGIAPDAFYLDARGAMYLRLACQ
jgi:hypothetical protein